MKHKVTLPDGQRVMEGEGGMDGGENSRMFGVVTSADSVELSALLLKDVRKICHPEHSSLTYMLHVLRGSWEMKFI